MVGAAARAWVTSPQRAAMAIDRLMALRLVSTRTAAGCKALGFLRRRAGDAGWCATFTTLACTPGQLLLDAVHWTMLTVCSPTGRRRRHCVVGVQRAA